MFRSAEGAGVTALGIAAGRHRRGLPGGGYLRVISLGSKGLMVLGTGRPPVGVQFVPLGPGARERWYMLYRRSNGTLE